MSDNPLVDAIENILLVPSSDFYLPKILYDPGGNALDPRTIDQLDLGTISVLGLQLGVGVRNFSVHGLSNVQVIMDADGNPDIQVDGDTVTFHAQLPNTNPAYQRPPSVPNQVQASGELDITIGAQKMPPGTLSITMQTVADLTGVFTATESQGGNLATLEIGFTQLSVNPVLSPGNLVITIDLDTSFAPTINYVLNQPANQATLLQQVNQKLASPDVLQGLSQVATQQARAALASS